MLLSVQAANNNGVAALRARNHFDLLVSMLPRALQVERKSR
jgi:hypothetical protein